MYTVYKPRKQKKNGKRNRCSESERVWEKIKKYPYTHSRWWLLLGHCSHSVIWWWVLFPFLFFSFYYYYLFIHDRDRLLEFDCNVWRRHDPSDRGGRDFDQRRAVSLSLSSYRRLLSCENEMFWVREGGERLGSDRHPFPHNQNERRRKRRKRLTSSGWRKSR